MKHIFDIEIAEKYGVNSAIILENLGYWIDKNEKNGVKFFDGYTWTYNSRKALKGLFPYMSEKQIATAFQKLIDDGLVITGNYNKSTYDRTLWYAITKKGKCILHFGKMEDAEKENGITENVKPIPNINTNINTNINNKERKKVTSTFEEIINEFNFNEEVKITIYEFIKMRTRIKKPLTDYALKLLLQKLLKLGRTAKEQIEILNNSIEHSWQGIFEVKKGGKGNERNSEKDDEVLRNIFGECYADER